MTWVVPSRYGVYLLRKAALDHEISLIEAHRHGFTIKYLRAHVIADEAGEFLLGRGVPPQTHPLIR